MADKLETRGADYSEIWPRESGVVLSVARSMEPASPQTLRFYGSSDFSVGRSLM
jgi:hypothetical protein